MFERVCDSSFVPIRIDVCTGIVCVNQRACAGDQVFANNPNVAMVKSALRISSVYVIEHRFAPT